VPALTLSRPSANPQRPPWLGSTLALALSAEASRRDVVAGAPCREVEQALANRDRHPLRQSPFRQDLPKTQVSRARDAFHRQGLAAHGAPEGAPHHEQTAAIPRLGHLGPPFDMHSRRSARPVCARFFTGGDAPHVAYRLLQQIRATNTPVELLDLDLSGGDNRTLAGASASPIERSDSLARAGPTGCSQPRGCALTDTQHPSKATARADGFTPT